MRNLRTPAGSALLFGLAYVVCGMSGAAEVALVTAGRPVAKLVCLVQDDACAAAAADLQRCLEAMSGARLGDGDLAFEATPDTPVVVLATATEAAEATILDAGGRRALQELRPEGFLIQTRSQGRGAPCVAIVGRDPEGLAFGVYEFLESLGCRWYLPGELGEHIPQRKTVQVSEGLDVRNPDFILRNMWWGYGGRPDWQKDAYTLWRKRNKMGGVEASMGHNLQRIVSSQEFGEKRPEYFPLREGVRYVPERGGEHGWQPCTSNPEVVAIAARKAIAYFDENPDAYSFSLSPVDGYGWCECENCTAQDPPAFRGNRMRGKGRRMSIFANAVAERLAEKHPDKYVCWYAYAGAVEAPEDVGVHPNVVISLAHYGWCGCNIHALQDPECPINPNFLEILNDWAAKNCKLFIREYWATLVPRTDMPARICAAYSLAEDIPFLKSKGVIGFSSESVTDYGACAMNFWMAGRKMWDAEADTSALVADFCGGMYGPAAEEMRAYFEEVVRICRARGCRSPSFSDEELADFHARVDRAAALCETPRQRDRVRLTQDSLDFADQFRDYLLKPSGEKREALVSRANELRDARSLAVDFTAFIRGLGKKTELDVEPARTWLKTSVVPLSTETMPPTAQEVAFTIRGEHAFLILAKRGERIRGRYEVRRLGRYLSGGAFALMDPAGTTLCAGEASVGEPGEFDATATRDGVHVLAVNTGRNAARVYADNQYFCLVGTSLGLLGTQPDGYVCLAPDAKAGTVVLSSPSQGDPAAPGETAMVTVFDSDGARIAQGDTVAGDPVPVTLRRKPGQQDHVWRIKLGKAPKGTIEDLELQFADGMNPVVATHPSRLLVRKPR